MDANVGTKRYPAVNYKASRKGRERRTIRENSYHPFGLIMRKEKGAILFICIWALVILSILSLGVAGRVNSEMQFAKYLRDSLISLYAAKAALSRALVEIKNDDTPSFYNYYELVEKRNVSLGEGSFEFNFSDESGMVNINTADVSVLGRLPGMDATLAQAVIESGKRPFAAKEEILLVDGITKDIFLQFKGLITVNSSGTVNINTASEDVLRIYGLSEDLIGVISDYRKGEDGEEFTEDDAAYTFLPGGISPAVFGTTSNYLRLNIATEVSGRSVRNYSIVFEVSSGKILAWQEA